MQFEDYQQESRKTAIYPGQGTTAGLCYTALGLGETGEVQGKVKKILRDKNGIIDEDSRWAIAKELGDILWYISSTCDELNISLDTVAQINIMKLNKRQQDGTLSGNGDNR